MMRKPSDGSDRQSINVRTRVDLKERLERIAAENGRSLAQEVERRLDASLASSAPPSFEDVRLMIRSEILAAMGEIARLRPDLVLIDEASPLTREVAERATRMQSAMKGPSGKFRSA